MDRLAGPADIEKFGAVKGVTNVVTLCAGSVAEKSLDDDGIGAKVTSFSAASVWMGATVEMEPYPTVKAWFTDEPPVFTATITRLPPPNYAVV